MNKKIKNLYEKVNQGMISLYVSARGNVSNERGVTTVEWVGLAAVMVALMFIINTAMKAGDGSGIANGVISKIQQLIGDTAKSGG